VTESVRLSACQLAGLLKTLSTDFDEIFRKGESGPRKKGKSTYSSVMDKSMTELRSVTCHMGSHSVTCYPTQVSVPHLNPSHTGWYSI